MGGRNITVQAGDVTVSVTGGQDDTLSDVSNALHAELKYVVENHVSVDITVDPFADNR